MSWLLVDVNFGLMDGFYIESEEFNETWVDAACDSLNEKYPGASFIATRVVDLPPGEGRQGRGISDFCFHNSTSHIEESLFTAAMRLRETRENQDKTRKAESALLGSILLNPDVLADLKDLQPGHFQDCANKKICAAILELHESESSSVDVTNLVHCLRKNDDFELIGGASCLAMLANSVPNSAHAVYYFNILQERLAKEMKFIPIEDKTAKHVEWMLFGDEGVCDWLHRIEGKIDQLLSKKA